MTVVAELHESHGATFTERGDRRVVDHYGRPERVHQAVRNVVGTIEMGYGVLEVTGDDRVDFVDNAVSNRVPETDGEGVYALLLDAQGGIEMELYVYSAGEKLLCFVPPGRADGLAAEWSEKTFIQDVAVRAATDDFGVFGVHGPKATEKIASVLTGPGSPDAPLSFVRGTLGDWGVTVVRTDDLTGEEGYEVICDADDADKVFDALINHGLNAAPFGYRTLEYLLLEAGDVGAAVFDGDGHVSDVTRGDYSPALDAPIALALVEYGLDAGGLCVRIDGDNVDAELVDLPFVEGSARSRRLPQYD